MTSSGIPRLVVREPVHDRDPRFASAFAEIGPLGTLLGAIGGSGEEARVTLLSLIRGLIDEGTAYAQSEPGQRWERVLADSPAVQRGWLLWNQLNLDYYLRNAQTLPDSPSALLEAAMQHLASIDATTLIAELSRVAITLEAEDSGRSHASATAQHSATRFVR
jgi:hypothetical protein